MAGIAWVNGRLLPPEEAAISPLDPGFMYGQGLFETMRAYKGRVFRLPQHLDRLLAGAEQLDLTPPERDYITEAIEQALADPQGRAEIIDLIRRLNSPEIEPSRPISRVL